MKKEIWKKIKGLNGNYSVSNHGRIMAHAKETVRGGHVMRLKERIMKTPPNNWGYCYVLPTISYKKTKTLRVHRLVAEAFLPNPNNYPYVNHVDGIKTNNHADNLEWCDQKHNLNHAMKLTGGWQKRGQESGKTKLTNKQVLKMCEMFESHTDKELSAVFKVTPSNVNCIRRGITWSWLTAR